MFVSVHALAHHGDWWWRCGRLECQLPDMPTHPAQTELLNTTVGFMIILPLHDTCRHHKQHFTPKRFEAPLITKRLQLSYHNLPKNIRNSIPWRQFHSSGIWHCFSGWAVPDISKELVWFFNSMTSIVTRLWPGPYRVQFQAGVRNFSLIHNIQISCGAHKASYSMGTKGSFLGGKVTRA